MRTKLKKFFHGRIPDLLLLIGFPVFLTYLAECNSSQNVVEVFNFFSAHPTVMLFDFLFFAVVFLALSLLVKYYSISVGILGTLVWLLSSVEYFKFGVSGTHFVVSDMIVFLSGATAALDSYVDIRFNFLMILHAIILLLLCFLCAYFKLQLRFQTPFPKAGGAIALCMMVLFFAYPTCANAVYHAFGVDNEKSRNIYMTNRKYESNAFFATFLQSVTETVENSFEMPDDYSEEKVEKTLSRFLCTNGFESEAEKPTVIFIMDEAFSDFRTFFKSEKLADYYRDYDAVLSSPSVRTIQTVVPTFGSYTCRSEFELMFGLPIYSLADVPTPHLKIPSGRKALSVPMRLQACGYKTTYIHPFVGGSYKRDEYFTDFGFDRVLFLSDLADTYSENDYRRGYLSDAAAFQSVKDILSETDEAQYIFLCTMQNHQPYFSDDKTQTEFDVYLDGVQKTSSALLELISWLENYPRDCVLIFGGDHYPLFSSDETVYKSVIQDDSQMDQLFFKDYLIFENHGAKHLKNSQLPQENISLFYLPNAVLRLCGYRDTLSDCIDDCMKTTPVYSGCIDKHQSKNDVLDTLTYDLVMGEEYASQYVFAEEKAS